MSHLGQATGTLTAAEPGAAQGGAGAADALFAEARRRRRRRRLAGIVTVLAACAVAVAAAVWQHAGSGSVAGGASEGVAATAGRSPAAAAVWFDGTRLRTGEIYLNGKVTERPRPEVSADPLPLVRAGNRVYWVDPAGAFVPSQAWYPTVIRYLNLATGAIGLAGPGSTAFLSADGRYLLMARTSTVLAEMPAAGGRIRQRAVPRGWYLPGGNGLPQLGYQGIATANGVLVQSSQDATWGPQALALWNPASGRVRVLGRGLTALGAYTPVGARHSLLAWLPAACRFPDNCRLDITDTATMATRTVRSPLQRGFAAGGAFSPDGSRLAVFVNTAPAQGRLALVDVRTGTVRVARGPRLTLGEDVGWALWLPGGTHLLAGTGTGSYLADAATLSVRRLALARASGQARVSGQDVNFTAAILPPRPRAD